MNAQEMENGMIERVADLAKRRMGFAPDRVVPLGGGFYGRVFLAESAAKPYPVVFKLYLYPNLADREALQLATLAKHALFKMPDVYFVERGENGAWDALAMEYIAGVNAGKLKEIPEESRERLANEMVDNLLSYHDAVHPEGFGALEANAFFADWRESYLAVARGTAPKAEALFAAGELDAETLDIVRDAISRYGEVFREPIGTARLIHGDYNTWNILLTEDLRNVKAVIDPFNCCWGDSEYDLYQLDNANGKAFGLLDLYAKKRSLSAGFRVKKAYYELFCELNHFFDAHVPIANSNIPAQARILRERMWETV